MKWNYEQRWQQWVTLLFLATIWGSSFILMKQGLKVFSHLEVAAYRVFIASFVLLPIAIPNLRSLSKRHLPALLISGAVGNGIPAFLFATAQTEIDSAIAGVLNALTPLFALIVGVLLFGLRVKWFNALGVLLGLGAASGLLLVGYSQGGNQQLIYLLMAASAALCYGIVVNVIKKYLHDLNARLITALSLFLVGPPLGIYLFAGTDFVTHATAPGGWTALLYISILGTFGTAMAVIIFNQLIKRTTVLFATTVTYLIPVVALLWGLGDGETLSLGQLGMVLGILGGVYLVNRSPRAKKPTA